MEDTHLQITKKAAINKSSDFEEFIPLINKVSSKVGNPNILVEKTLTSRLLAGDRSAFSFIFNAYYKDLVIFAASFTKDVNIAEEIVQDTFVRLWEDHELIKVDISLKSYLLKTVRNKCIDWYRHKKIKQKHAGVMKERTPCFTCDTDNYLMFSELQEQLDIALNKLPDEISTPFRMNRSKGLKYHEIADILGVSVRTIEVRIGKALHMLHNYLKEYLMVIIVLLGFIYK